MKKYFKLAFALLFVLTFIGLTVYVNLGIDNRHYDNVFDEMAQNLQKRPNGTLAENLGGEVSYREGFLEDNGVPPDSYFYSASNEKGENTALPKTVTSVSIEVSQKPNEEPIFIYYYYQLTDRLEVQVSFDYFKDTQTLSQTLTIKNNGTKSDFQQALVDKGITQKEFQKQTRDLLGPTVIRAWIGAKDSKSHFSEKNWGDVKISPMIVKED